MTKEELIKENEQLKDLVEQWKNQSTNWMEMYYEAKRSEQMYKKIGGFEDEELIST